MTGWPDETRPGVPLNPERDGWHWVVAANPAVSIESAPWWWSAANQHWLPPCDVSGALPLSPARVQWRYLAPCLTPSEAQAQLAAARREALEEAARLCEEQRGLWPQWHPDIAAHQEPVNRALDYGRRQGCEVCAAAIRALAGKEAGDV